MLDEEVARILDSPEPEKWSGYTGGYGVEGVFAATDHGRTAPGRSIC
jgi:hypothetical protein